MKYISQLLRNLFNHSDFIMEQALLEKEFSVARRNRIQTETKLYPSPIGWMKL